MALSRRLAARPQWLRRYLSLAYTLRMGNRRDMYTRAEFIDAWEHTLRDLCFYKSRRAAEALLARWFEIMPGGEADWIRYRVAHHRILRHAAPVLDLAAFDPLLGFVGNGRAGHVYVLRKPAGEETPRTGR